MSKNYISTSSEWTFPLIQRYDEEIARIAEGYQLDTYPNQIELISAEQMLDAYSSVGMPLGYHHWSFGKKFVTDEQTYRRGQMGLAFEIVINSNPCIAYLMEENTLPMQALVIAHACYGHNSFFKNNYLFTSWTSADAIIDYLLFAKNFVAECEQRYGEERVELMLDSCHALMSQGVDRYKRPGPLSMEKEKVRQTEREAYLQSQVNELWSTIPVPDVARKKRKKERFVSEPQENLLYFIEKNAPLLEPWEREIVRIVRKMSQYFYPQRLTKVMNEGWACFWHYRILNDLYDQGLVNDGFMFECLQSHTNVVYQPPFNHPHYSGLNPYTLGYNMMTDIRRICDKPTAEDRRWFPDIAGGNWLEVMDFAMRNFKDESFIAQYLSPKLIRDLRLFTVIDDDSEQTYQIGAIHDDNGYQQVRQLLAEQYNIGSNEPNIHVYDVDYKGDRSLTLQHMEYHRRPLETKAAELVLKHVRRLWGFPVRLEAVKNDGTTAAIAQID